MLSKLIVGTWEVVSRIDRTPDGDVVVDDQRVILDVEERVGDDRAAPAGLVAPSGDLGARSFSVGRPR